MVKVEILKDGVWEEASSHTKLIDANNQKDILASNGNNPDDIRVVPDPEEPVVVVEEISVTKVMNELKFLISEAQKRILIIEDFHSTLKQSSKG